MASSQELQPSGLNFTPTIRSDSYDFISTSKADLTGTSVFITGASRGIGKETALAFARAGASKIAVGARTPLSRLEYEIHQAATEANRAPPKVLLIELDVTSADSATAAAKAVKETFGGLDILVNNAGYLESFTPIADSDPDEWWKTWEVNVKGPYLLTRAFVPLLIETKDGLQTILNVSSIGAHFAMAGASAYQTTKLALLRFSEFINTEYGDKGVLAYSIHPGGVLTDLAKNMPKETHDRLLIDKPALAADTVVWLTKERREWLAGRYVSVTWDMEQLLEKKDVIVKGDLLKVRMAVTL